MLKCKKQTKKTECYHTYYIIKLIQVKSKRRDKGEVLRFLTYKLKLNIVSTKQMNCKSYQYILIY